MARVCEVPGCDNPTEGATKLRARYCSWHRRRLDTYGQAEDWDPIPLDRNDDPAPPAKVAMLRDLHLHDRLGAWCSARLTAQTPDYIRRMSDHELYGLLRQFWPT